MKTQGRFKQILFVVLLGVISPTIALSRGGTGVDGGGGNAKPSDPITKADIARFIASPLTNVALKMLYNSASNFKGSALFGLDPNSFSCSEMPTCYDEYVAQWKLFIGVNTKLFYSESGKTIFDAIDSARIYLQDQACLDPQTGLESDASASISQNAICISASRLTEKIDKADLEDKLLVLLMHEYSHLLGTNEHEALAIEAEMKFWRQDYNKFATAIVSFQHSYTAAFKNLYEYAVGLQNNFSNLSPDQTCMRLASLYNKRQIAENAIGDFISNDLEMLPYSTFDYIPEYNLALKNVNQIFYCATTQLKDVIEDIKTDFGDDEHFEVYRNLFQQNEEQIMMKDAFSRLGFAEYLPSYVLETFTMPIRNVSTGNRHLLKQEIDDIVSALSHFRVRYKALFGNDPVTEGSKVVTP